MLFYSVYAYIFITVLPQMLGLQSTGRHIGIGEMRRASPSTWASP
ncbi:MAG: hypothetical protein R3A10_12075 [Caldilineaceae bacterium]